MGDRFYAQQKEHKPKRRLKKDVIAELTETLGDTVEGLDRLTIKSLEDLIKTIRWRLDDD
jgi:hypothetical protein